MWAVRIKGKHSTLIVEYESFDAACAGAERARMKIAFAMSHIEVVENGR